MREESLAYASGFRDTALQSGVVELGFIQDIIRAQTYRRDNGVAY